MVKRDREQATYLRNRVIVIVLRRQESRACHRSMEERRPCIPSVRYQVLHDRSCTCRFAPDCYTARVATEEVYLQFFSLKKMRLDRRDCAHSAVSISAQIVGPLDKFKHEPQENRKPWAGATHKDQHSMRPSASHPFRQGSLSRFMSMNNRSLYSGSPMHYYRTHQRSPAGIPAKPPQCLLPLP